MTKPYFYNQFGINYKVKYLKNGEVAAEYDMSKKINKNWKDECVSATDLDIYLRFLLSMIFLID